MNENLVLVTIAKDWDYMINDSIDRLLLQATPEQCKVLNKVAKQSNLYIEFAKNYTNPMGDDE